MLTLAAAFARSCVSRMNPDIAITKANMTMTCSGEPKCVDLAASDVYNDTSCPPENEICGVLRAFVEEYTNELPEGTNASEAFSYQMCGYFTDRASCQLHCGEECVKTKKTKIPYSTDYYYNRKKYSEGRPKGNARTGEWICPGHGLSSGATVGVAAGVVFGVTALIILLTVAEWKKVRRNR